MIKKKKKLRNLFEKRIDKQLKRSRVSYKYEEERILYLFSGHYIPDFIVETPLGKVYIECKGYLRPEDKRKLVAVKKCNPQLDIRILFYSLNPKYIKWAIKSGFRYSVEKIPKDWLLGL